MIFEPYTGPRPLGGDGAVMSVNRPVVVPVIINGGTMRNTAYEPGHRTQEIPTLAQRVTRPQTRAAEAGWLLLALLVLVLSVGVSVATLLRGDARRPASVWLTPGPTVPPPYPLPTVTQ